MARRIVFSQITEQEWRVAHEKHGSVYFILDAGQDRMKIGHSHDPWKRLNQLQTGSSAKLSLAAVIAGSDAIEKRMHFDMREHNVHLEWFKDAAECIAALNKLTNNSLMCRLIAGFRPAREIDVWWEWDQEHKIHLKHVFDDERLQWVGPLMYAGRPSARPGWSATTTELVEV